jgi:hypothetical protein
MFSSHCCWARLECLLCPSCGRHAAPDSTGVEELHVAGLSEVSSKDSHLPAAATQTVIVIGMEFVNNAALLAAGLLCYVCPGPAGSEVVSSLVIGTQLRLVLATKSSDSSSAVVPWIKPLPAALAQSTQY